LKDAISGQHSAVSKKQVPRSARNDKIEKRNDRPEKMNDKPKGVKIKTKRRK
jgi:hypothetical protein